MTISLAILALLAAHRRTLARVAKRFALANIALTISIPPFFKLEIKTEAKGPKQRRTRR